MNFIIWLIVGGIVGWLASILMHTNGQQGLFLNILVGIVGAFVAGVVLTPLLGITTINQNNFSLPGLLVSLVGAIILLAVINLFRVGGLRHR
ncbi:MAG: GlsB/YeaQ/YmgE family stress response membrane protein [Candidatus Promineifilaceae bacterium]|nr:GlsB/YeaQ/YmgE family stress response membrane protein [Chloroflexota bacterium]